MQAGRAFLAAGLLGGAAWFLIQRHRAAAEAQAQQPTAYWYIPPEKEPESNTGDSEMFKGIFSMLTQGLSGLGRRTTTTTTTTTAAPIAPPRTTPAPQAGAGVQGLLDLIGSVEAPKGYDQVYGGIRAADRPESRVGKRLTQMTVGEVLAWQDSIDTRYPSEAAGRYQVMEDTLRGLVNSGQVSASERFDAKTQDRIAILLMQRRGLSDYQSGTIGATTFAQKLSQEWASLPAITQDKRGRAAAGQSYYAGDGLNRSHVNIDTILAAVRSV